MGEKYIKRITLFKLPTEEGINTLLAQYDVLRKTAQKDGKPYIISNESNRVINASEERAQGYTIAVQTTFASMEDVAYYDKECQAHWELKAVARQAGVQGVATMLFESDMKPVA